MQRATGPIGTVLRPAVPQMAVENDARPGRTEQQDLIGMGIAWVSHAVFW